MSGGGQRQTTSQQQSSTTGYSGTTASQSVLPDWVNQAGPELYNNANQFVQGFNPNNPLSQQNAGLAGAMGNAALPAYGEAAHWYGNDRGGGYASTAIEQLLRAGGSGGGASFGGGVGNGPAGQGVRDTSWRNFTDYDINAYTSPYTGQVVDAAMDDLDRAAQIESLRRSGAASRAGTFGGARHGVADAVAAGELARASGGLSAQLRDQAFTRASDLIGRDQMGDFGAQASNQNADLGRLNAETSRYNANVSAGASRYGNQIQGLIAAMNGGLGLGGLDLARGGAWQGFGESAYDRNRQGGLDQTSRDAMPFDMYQGLGGILGGIPTEQGQIGATSGTSSTESTMSGRARNTEQAGAQDYLGAALALFGMFGGG